MTDSRIRRSRRLGVLLVLLASLLPLALGAATGAAGTSGASYTVGTWLLYETADPQPVCGTVGWPKLSFRRQECGFGRVTLAPAAAGKTVSVQFVDGDGTVVNTQSLVTNAAGTVTFDILPDTTWDAGPIKVRAAVAAPDTGSSEITFLLNPLEVSAEAEKSTYKPGEPITFTGTVEEYDSVGCCADQRDPVPAAVTATLHTATGEQLAGPVAATANDEGQYTVSFPGSATAGLTAGPETGFELGLAARMQASYDDPTPYVGYDFAPKTSGRWVGAGAGAATVRTPPRTLLVENSFVSAVGWVKPGETYPFRVFVKNFTADAASGAVVRIPAVDGTTFTKVDSASATIGADGAITWNVGSVPPASAAGPALKTLVVEARSDTLRQDPRIVWKNLSSTATLSYDGGPTGLTSTSHGPKVIPPRATFDTARYGDRPFPVVPVDYLERKHDPAHTGDRLATVINSAGYEGSTFNLFQEMSYGQLYPNGTVPSAGVATAGWDVDWNSPERQQNGFKFTTPSPLGACHGVTVGPAAGTPVLPERIKDGWYQLPGDTQYYGGDQASIPGIVPALVGGPRVGDIDRACGPTAKSVYDAAHIADPEIDYSDFDTDKDGVVDFFMMVFVGTGGNGASQLSVPPYDNIWPHSSSLEFTYTDPETGQKGYVSDDQLKDLQGRPLFYTSTARATMTTTDTGIPVYVRVGPYNVNPEDAIEHASVISHEYGHSLGLPDYYSGGTRETYGTWNLMATDYSQHMDINARQELGWVVPRVLEPGQTTTITGWADSKVNTHRIDWQQPDGTPYSLTGPTVDNGEAYVAKLPARRVIDPAKVASGASPTHVWWSGSGNDYGCAPSKGHNLDIHLPELRDLPEGTPVSLTFKSLWDIEWDYDYGFVMISTDGGKTYRSLPSAKNYTTPGAVNPNANACQQQYGNGLTGSSGSYATGTQVVDRRPDAPGYPDTVFLEDQYDLSSAVGSDTVLRFSYSSDPGLARPGWFIDDLKITAGETTVYETDFESSGDPDDPRVFSGGCKEDGRTAEVCTAGWGHVDATEDSPADHAYYLELRDRSGFDFDSRGQADRAPGQPTFAAGLSLVYTDEAHGYGNSGTSDPPAQTVLDSQPQPGVNAPNLDDAAWTAAAGDNVFSDSGAGWTDNYADPASPDKQWHFRWNCLSFEVLSMTGNGNGPRLAPGDLTGTVRVTTGPGCAPFDYGAGAVAPNTAPTAVAQARPTETVIGEPVVFDGSASSDDAQVANDLAYAWDFEGDGTVDATTQVATHRFTRAGTFDATLTVTDAEGLSDTTTIAITVAGRPDLEIVGLAASNSKAREGERVTLTATVKNGGSAEAAASSTEFVLDGSTVLGVVDTPAIPAGETRQVSLSWDTKGVKGTHTIRATADRSGVVAESNETNNAGQLTVEIRGNKVQNGSFEQTGSSGSSPEAWNGSSTGAGDASWSGDGADGSKGASMSGNGSSAALFGAPSWTSAPVAVTPGETLEVVASVRSTGLSTAPTVGLAYVGAAGQLLETVAVLTAPLSTAGFTALEQTVTVPAGVTQVRLVLSGFSAFDPATRGVVVFDDVGVFVR